MHIYGDESIPKSQLPLTVALLTNTLQAVHGSSVCLQVQGVVISAVTSIKESWVRTPVHGLATLSCTEMSLVCRLGLSSVRSFVRRLRVSLLGFPSFPRKSAADDRAPATDLPGSRALSSLQWSEICNTMKVHLQDDVHSGHFVQNLRSCWRKITVWYLPVQCGIKLDSVFCSNKPKVLLKSTRHFTVLDAGFVLSCCHLVSALDLWRLKIL
jgi:hypothetical protein